MNFIDLNTKITDLFARFPELKPRFIARSPKYKRLNNPLVFKTVARFASLADVAKIAGENPSELLEFIGEFTGREVQDNSAVTATDTSTGETPEWVKTAQFSQYDARHREEFFLPEITKRAQALPVNIGLKVIQEFDPIPLYPVMEELGYSHYTRTMGDDEYHVYFLRLESETASVENGPETLNVLTIPVLTSAELANWTDYMDRFPQLDVRKSSEDPFKLIYQIAVDLKQGQGFTLVQKFDPMPLKAVLEPLGFEHRTTRTGDFRQEITFCRTVLLRKAEINMIGGKIPLVIQSATPVMYPVIMRLLQSQELMSVIDVKELKVWEETEKHLGWMVSGKADISFSAVIAAAKLFAHGNDIRMLSVDVWDNFYLLTRDPDKSTLADFRGDDLDMPLFREAPPAVVTRYLMGQFQEDPDKFRFHYGKPFGRPADIARKLISGETEHGLLREPEASYALAADSNIREALSYSELWNQLHPESRGLPNAGLVVKNGLLEKYPEMMALFAKEVQSAVEWVVTHPDQAAAQSWDIMGRTEEEVRLFLSRVRYDHVPAPLVSQEIQAYLDVTEGGGRYSTELHGDGFLTDPTASPE